MMYLKIGSLIIPTLAALEIEQAYDPVNVGGIIRTSSGAAIKQATWKKTRITTSGSGWIPDGLDTLDTGAQLVLSCVKPRIVPANFITREATLPVKRRSDAGHEPWGWAIMPSGQAVNTPVTLAANIATLDEVVNAVSYHAAYLPEFTVYATDPTDSGTRSTADYAWQLVCEEV